ncbi:MAG: glyoxalase [Planctomycetes bacterium]|nr:glyoxalase [Planctomycetota bacterium]
MSIRAIQHVQLAMPEGGEASARVFYEGLLGLPEQAKPPALATRGGAWFGNGHVDVHLGVEPGFRPATKAHPAFVVEDLAAMIETLAAAGHAAEVGVPIEGWHRVYVHDPFGNRIELMERSSP